MSQTMYRYICCDCEHSVIRRATSSHNGTSRKCLDCGSRNMLREDHPLLTMKCVK